MVVRGYMHGSQEEHQALLRLLLDVTSPDPAVQARNVVQLQQLAEWPAAPYALLDLMIQESCSVPIRQAAGLIFRRLVHKKSPNFTEVLNMDVVTPLLIRMLADPNPALRTGASLIAAELFPGYWPTLPQTLLECAVTFCQSNTHHDASLHILGLAACTRILCEERSSALRRLVTTTEACCAALNELLCCLVRTAADAVAVRDINALPFAQAVMNTVSSCFGADILSVREVMNEEVFSGSDEADDKRSGGFSTDDDDDDDASNAGGSSYEMPSYMLSYVTQLNYLCCALIVRVMHSFLTDADDSVTLLLAQTSYITATLQWGTFWNDATEAAVDALFPHILRLVESAPDGLVDERVTVQCLDFLADLAQSVVGGAALLSRNGDSVASALFRCALLPRALINAPDTDSAAHGTDGTSDAATSVRRALVCVLSAMSVSCAESLLTYLVPRMASVLAPAEEVCTGRNDYWAAAVEAALFLLSAIVEELFDVLDEDFVACVAKGSGATLANGPDLLRYQSVRCVARIAGKCAVSRVHARQAAVPSALCVLIEAIGDRNTHVRIEGIRAVTSVLTAWLGSVQRASHDAHMNDDDNDNNNNNNDNDNDINEGAVLCVDIVCVSGVLDCLLTALPSMHWSARGAVYRCFAQVLPLHSDAALSQRAATQLLALAESLTECIRSNVECTEALGADFVSLLSAMSDIVVSDAAVAREAVLPLSAIAAAFTRHYVEILSLSLSPALDELSLPQGSMGSASLLRVYGDDICALLFDILDICCDATFSDADCVCSHGVDPDAAHVLQTALLTCGESSSDHLIALCLCVLELRPTDAVQLRRAGFALLSTALRCGLDGTVLHRMYVLCNREISGGAVSNALLCLAIIFYLLAFDKDDACHAAAELLHTSIQAEEEWSALGNALQRCLTEGRGRREKHIRTNAFACAVALAALQPMAFEGHAHAALVRRAVGFLQRMGVAEQFRTIMALLASLSHGSFVSIPVDLRNVICAFVASAPPAMANNVKERWAQWIGP